MEQRETRSQTRGLSIQVHLLLMTGAAILLAVGVFTAVSYNRQKKALLHGIDEKLLACTRLAHAVPPAGYFDRVLQGDAPVTEEAFLEVVDRYNQLCSELGLQYLWSCMVIGDDIVFTTATSPGKDRTRNDHAPFLSVHSDPAAFDVVFGTMQPDFSSFHNEWGAGRMVLVPYMDVHGRKYCVGASLSIDQVHARVRHTLLVSLAIGAGILVICLVVAGIMSTSLSRPIVRLTKVAESIATGDLTPVIEPKGSLEVQRLARSLAEMRDAIQKAMHALREHRDHLEDLVYQRTADLERSNKELEQFAYIASHDLREPLRKVKSFAELFARKYKGLVDHEGRKYINFVVDGAERMQSLIEALLTYSRVGRDEADWGHVDLDEVLRGVLKSIDSTVRDAGAEVTVGALPAIYANPRLVGLVFQNLILNGIKFCRDIPPRVCVTATKRGAQAWQFAVQDNGIGIEQRHTERIFKIFQRLHTVDEYPGTGIGLALCKKIVEDHGGRMWVESCPGEGSTFFFTLSNTTDGNKDPAKT